MLDAPDDIAAFTAGLSDDEALRLASARHIKLRPYMGQCYLSTMTTCSIAGCEKAVKNKGLCIAHYTRLRRHGDPLGGKIITTKAGEARRWLFAHVAHLGDECLTWPFSCFRNGRAQIEVDGRSMNAARLMCILAHGDPPHPKSQAAHSCGRGHLACVHPGHLSWKTAVQNEADKAAHGTKRFGVRIHTTKLSPDQIQEIRQLKGQMSQRAIADLYGVSQPNIGMIHRGKTWRQV